MPPTFDLTNADNASHSATAQIEQSVRRAFREHKERIHPFLSPALQELQATDLHDGLWQSLRINAEQKTLQLRFLCGDMVHGYFDLFLEYQGVTLSPMETSLLCLLASEETAGIDTDEIDVELGSHGTPPIFVHRIAWHTGIVTGRSRLQNQSWVFHSLGPEIELRFHNLVLQKTPLPNRKQNLSDDFINVVPRSVIS